MEIDPAPSGLTVHRSLRAAIGVLLLAPFVMVLLAAGVVFLWENPWLWRWIWVPVPLCWIIAWLLLRYAKKRFGSLWRPSSEILPHWTEQDQAAWTQVVAYADEVGEVTTTRFLSTDLYLDATRELATRMAEHYHPGTADAIEALTIPEILTAAELAVSDVRRFVEQYIPGSHLMTIRWLKRAPQVTTTWSRIKPLYYVATVLWHPWTVLSRAATDGAVVSPVMEDLKKEGLAGIYRAFLLQLGKYLIELNSHRLKVGPERWRAVMQQNVEVASHARTSAQETAAQSRPVPTLRIAVVGQVKAGKSSLINALIGQQQAAVDILPLTSSIQQYALRPPQVHAELILLDTAGYEHEGMKADRFEETMAAVREAAMMVLVVNACDPAREPDRAFLRSVETWFGAHPHARRAPILAVVTHIDGLSPSMEWQPPYDGWLRSQPARVKEQNIRDVVQDIQQLAGRTIAGVVPACTDMDKGRVYGIQEWVVPALLNLLPQAEAKHLVDVLYKERDQGRIGKLMSQLWNASAMLAKYQFCGVDAVLPDQHSAGDREPPVE